MDPYDDKIPVEERLAHANRAIDDYLKHLRVRAGGVDESGVPISGEEQRSAIVELLHQESVANNLASQAASTMIDIYYETNSDLPSELRNEIRTQLISRNLTTTTELDTLSPEEVRHLVHARMAKFKGLS